MTVSTARPRIRVLVPRQIASPPYRIQGEIRSLAGTCMGGTGWHVRWVDDGGRAMASLGAQIAALLDGIENQMSHFRPDSDLRRFAGLPAGDWLAMPAAFSRVLRSALEIARLSDGAFDPTLAPQVDAWGFGAGKRYTDTGFMPPKDCAMAASKAAWQTLDIDAHDRLRQPGGIALNFAAIAKGFAVDAVSEFLSQSGHQNHLIEIGGELRGAGLKPDGQPWWVALELPGENCPLPATRIALHGLAVATSGDYRRAYHMGDRLIHHTIDPRSGMPSANRLSSVTVLHHECMQADAWATAMMVLGPEKGLALAERNQLCVLMQGRDLSGRWIETCSTAWQALLQ